MKRKTYGTTTYHYTYETNSGLYLECEFDCEPGEEETYWEPRVSETFELTSVKLDGIEIISLLHDHYKEQIEDRAYQHLLQEAQEL